MTWQTPTLESLRQLNRANIVARLNSGPIIPNSILRVMADSNAGLAFLAMLYLDYIAQQVMPDTATDWLPRFADIWLTNHGGGQKPATLATGTITATASSPGIIIPLGALLGGASVPSTTGGNPTVMTYQVTQQTTVGAGATSVPIAAIIAGAAGNTEPGAILRWNPAIAGVNGGATVVTLTGGADQETIDQLRVRVLQRIRQPPMGGDADDYIAWATAVPGVTRAWTSPLEMGPGTVTVRFMMDSLRASTGGFPLASDVAAVQGYLNTKHPVTAIDVFVVAPIPEPISFTLKNLNATDSGTMANIAASVSAMLAQQAAPASSVNGSPVPAQTIYSAWVSEAVMAAAGVQYFDLVMTDHIMPTPSSMATLGSILLG
jgi:uncharacterized phage protein gp47/JayE